MMEEPLNLGEIPVEQMLDELEIGDIIRLAF